MTPEIEAVVERVDAIKRGCLIGTYEQEAIVLLAALRQAEALAADRLLEIEAADRANYNSHAHSEEWRKSYEKAEAELAEANGQAREQNQLWNIKIGMARGLYEKAEKERDLALAQLREAKRVPPYFGQGKRDLLARITELGILLGRETKRARSRNEIQN